MRAIFRYPGSKWSIADWIIDHFPEGYERMVHLEPFVGSGAVFFNKAPGAVETINDLDSNIVNLFYVLREQPEELKRVLALTPSSGTPSACWRVYRRWWDKKAPPPERQLRGRQRQNDGCRYYTTAGKELQMTEAKPKEIGDVMHMVVEHIDHRKDQKVTLYRNGSRYTVFLTETGRGGDSRHVRADMGQEPAMKTYLKLVRAMVTEKYAWETRAGWVASAGEAKTA